MAKPPAKGQTRSSERSKPAHTKQRWRKSHRLVQTKSQLAGLNEDKAHEAVEEIKSELDSGLAQMHGKKLSPSRWKRPSSHRKKRTVWRGNNHRMRKRGAK